MRDINKSILFSFIAAACLSGMVYFAKQASVAHGNLLILVFRFLITGVYAACLILTARLKGNIISLRTTNMPLHLFRAVSASLAMYLLFYSLNNISVVTANILNLTHPLFSIFIASVILKEKASLSDVALCATGFIGVFFTLQPSLTESYNLSLISALMSGLFTSISIIGVRKLSKKEHPYSILLHNTVISLFISVILLVGNGIPQELNDLYPLFLVGIFGALYQDFIIRALSVAPAKIPSSLMYLSIAFSYVIGLTNSSTVYSITSIIGLMMIASTGIFITLGSSQK